MLFILNFRRFASTIPRPFAVNYNPYSQTIEVLDSKPQIIGLLKDLTGQIQLLEHALTKIL